MPEGLYDAEPEPEEPTRVFQAITEEGAESGDAAYARARNYARADEDDAPLYVDADEPRAGEPATLRLVPYYSWANREIGEMRVFQRR